MQIDVGVEVINNCEFLQLIGVVQSDFLTFLNTKRKYVVIRFWDSYRIPLYPVAFFSWEKPAWGNDWFLGYDL